MQTPSDLEVKCVTEDGARPMGITLSGSIPCDNELAFAPALAGWEWSAMQTEWRMWDE